MIKKTEYPWASGPAEILRHALGLLNKDTDTNRRLAMLLIDNAVEQMIKTYLSLPKRITGIKIPRRVLQEAFESFPVLLDTFEEHSSDKLEGIELGAIEWYHRLRNELYHQGIGLTVEREKVDVYGELASVLFNNLFGQPLVLPVDEKAELLGQFIQKWSELESHLTKTARDTALKDGMRRTRFPDQAEFLLSKEMISQKQYNELVELRNMRNNIVHNEVSYKETLTPKILDMVVSLIKNIVVRGA